MVLPKFLSHNNTTAIHHQTKPFISPYISCVHIKNEKDINRCFSESKWPLLSRIRRRQRMAVMDKVKPIDGYYTNPKGDDGSLIEELNSSKLH